MPELSPLEKEPENKSTPPERRPVWPNTLPPKWPPINVERRAHEQSGSPSARALGVLTGLSGWDQPPLGPPPGPPPAKGPGDTVSQLTGAFRPCLSCAVGMPVSAPLPWMGPGPALQRAALLGGPLRPRSQLVGHNSRQSTA